MEKLNQFTDFGKFVFSEEKMKERLPHPVYQKWKETVANESTLDRPTSDAIAHAMKDWALENQATHFCHWFQPMTGSTAEKHDSFVEPGEAGQPILRFSGKSLVKGEPDASSFPSGGLRATFEARGYTYWDCSSPAFIRDNILCIPSVFVSYNGESLDKKTPLLKSINAVNKAATKLVNILGDKDVKHIRPVVGLEQEYFLIDRKYYHKRLDIRLCQRTLFGAMPPKRQELDDHYFGSIPSRISEFMKDVNAELWKLGIYAKSEHNEVAPAQFEIAPIFSDVNVAVDQNLLMMDVLTSNARKHDFACILHEKPFNGVNGSGKHNNWSLMSDTGLNLFDPGDKPSENIRFLVFVTAFIQAVDRYPELLRMSSSQAGNDWRLGASEAPPAIISIYLGSYIEDILNSLMDETSSTTKTESSEFNPIHSLSYIPKDNTDRNRTSPMAFTGNKFEFRMLGSSLSASVCNVVLNSIMAETLNEFATELEGIKYREDIRSKALELCKAKLKKHSRIIFSKDGYSDEWVKEAEGRGLPNIKTYVESIAALNSEKATQLFTSLNVYSEKELKSREEILYEQYIKTIAVEMRVLTKMYRNEVKGFMMRDLTQHATLNAQLSSNTVVSNTLAKMNQLLMDLEASILRLESTYNDISREENLGELALKMRFNIVPLMLDVRTFIDQYEEIADNSIYQLPTYTKMLYY
ncbi:MAG: glutamine synthetase III [Erysipelotrichaceae bacterium]